MNAQNRHDAHNARSASPTLPIYLGRSHIRLWCFPPLPTPSPAILQWMWVLELTLLLVFLWPRRYSWAMQSKKHSVPQKDGIEMSDEIYNPLCRAFNAHMEGRNAQPALWLQQQRCRVCPYCGQLNYKDGNLNSMTCWFCSMYQKKKKWITKA